jgi:ubiquinone/menaquinone biosynthesis C-methylase UbiE
MVCGSGIMEDTRMIEASTFWDRKADSYAAQPIADQIAYETKLAETQRRLRPDMDVLEFGCGTGSTAIIHAPFVRQITAIDFSARMIAIARAKAAAAGIINVSFEQADITDLPPSADAYDAVLGFSILHLLKDPRDAMARTFRMLKPGGIFVSSTACLGDTMPAFKYLAPVGKALGVLPLLNVMTVSELVAALTKTGFAIEHQWQPGRGKALFVIARKPAAK